MIEFFQVVSLSGLSGPGAGLAPGRAHARRRPGAGPGALAVPPGHLQKLQFRATGPSVTIYDAAAAARSDGPPQWKSTIIIRGIRVADHDEGGPGLFQVRSVNGVESEDADRDRDRDGLAGDQARGLGLGGP
jgi:hypothetical protein